MVPSGLKFFISGNLKSECMLAGLGSEGLGGAILLPLGVLFLETHTQTLVGVSTACWNINTWAVGSSKMATPEDCTHIWRD